MKYKQQQSKLQAILQTFGVSEILARFIAVVIDTSSTLNFSILILLSVTPAKV
ncbi:MAG TPA: hypothetical protein V6C91_12495 [Coleofasciculaceae cyanobacterium]